MFGTLELARTESAHIGNAPLNGTEQFSSKKILDENGQVSSTSKKSFEGYLLDAMNKLNEQQMDVTALQEKVITEPDSVDIHDVTIAMAKAQMSLSLAQTVVERVVQGWNEITTSR